MIAGESHTFVWGVMTVVSGANLNLVSSAGGGLGTSRQTADIASVDQIFLSTVNLVVWQRPSRRATDVTTLIGTHRRIMRTVSCRCLTPAAVSAALAPLETTALSTDIHELCDLFQTLTGASDIGIRLEVTDRQSCPKFHSDKVTLRLMTTYYGAATQWLENGCTRQAVAGDVLLAKGELWGDESGACVHRSPPPSGPNTWRVLVTLDVV
jgi:hypothetical protein